MIRALLSSAPAAAAFRAAGPLVRRQLERMDDLERRDPGYVRQWQLDRADVFRRRWADRTPHYRAHPDQRAAPLSSLPVRTKLDVQRDTAAFWNSWVPARTVTTGGTSGAPLKLRVSAASFLTEWAHIAYAWRQAGVDLLDPKITFRGGSLGRGFDGDAVFYQRTYNHVVVSPFHLSDRTFEDLLRQVADLRPKAVWGYPSAITPFARWVERTGPHPELAGIRAVLLSSEGAFDWQLELFRRVFGATTVEWYGQSEKVAFAVRCAASPAYHVVPTYGVVESVDGRIVGSGLTNAAMPLLRYDTGDHGELRDGPCRCGSPFPVLAQVQGRWDQALVYGADDEPISTTALNFHDESFAVFDRFQFRQEVAGAVTLNVSSHVTVDAGTLAAARSLLQKRVGDRLEIEVRLVDGSDMLTSRGKIATIDQRYVPSLHAGSVAATD